MFAFNGLHVQRQGKFVDPLSIALPRSNLESVCAKRTRLIAFVTATIIAAMGLAAQTRLGRAPGLVDALRGLEFDLARHQSRFARFAADFLCSNPLRHRSDCSIRGFSGTSGLVAAARGRLRRPGLDWRSDVRSKLWPPVLG